MPSARRAAPSRSCITTSPTVPAPTATASVTKATERLAPIASRSAAGCTCTRSAISDGVSRGSSSAAPATPGSRWLNGAMPLNRCVTSVAPASAAARLVVGRGAVPDRDDDTGRAEHPGPREAGVGLGREGHDAHEPGRAVEQAGEPRTIDQAKVLDDVRAGRRRGTAPRGARRAHRAAAAGAVGRDAAATANGSAYDGERCGDQRRATRSDAARPAPAAAPLPSGASACAKSTAPTPLI